MNLPSHDFISAPLWLLTTLHLLTLTLHFAAMNFMLGGIVVVLFGRFENRWQNPVVRRFVALFPSVMAAVVTLGVAPLLFLQLVYGQQIYAATIVSGWFWLMVVAVAIVSYYCLYAAAFRGQANRLLALFLSLALGGFVYISFVYSSVFSLAEQPELIRTLYAANQGGTVLNSDVDSYLWRWLHMLTGAMAVGAFFFAWLGAKNDEAYRAGRTFFLVGMVGAFIAGILYLLALREVLLPFMRSPAAWWLFASVILALGSMHLLFKKRFIPTAALLLASLLGMVGVRHFTRKLFLQEHLEAVAATVSPQWSLIALFGICFFGAIAAVAYMLKVFFAAKG